MIGRSLKVEKGAQQMRILLTVVVGYLTDANQLRTKAFTEVLTHESKMGQVDDVVASRVKEIRDSWPNPYAGMVISVSHSIL